MDSRLSSITLEAFLEPVLLSLRVSIIAFIIVFILGTLTGKWMVDRRFRGQSVVETIIMLPLVLPPTVVGFLLIILFGNNSILGEWITWIFSQPVIFTWYAAVIASTVVAFPLMYQSAKAGFQNIDRDVEEAARVDGAGHFQTFLRISIPLASRALMAGGILSFARALGEFGATLMFAGNIPGVTQTVPTAIYIALDSGRMTLAWLWVITIIIISFIMLFIARTKNPSR
ncbi:molybdate ABC transporter permease subunit [Salinicoccus sp. ID82-1]|uniref:Molybdenum transport system permease n=1 Tax=Salinicoccus cyprini TaxID=2493691 RepID=A0A558AUT8_9STAP|nr:MULTISPECIES: molybdate ABC transporter permease subunit [Salinicoccus]MCG1010608.1 molybdate ABC transporter permease subunit [Salinicoccus sp. ID82-1]TVT28027.1 molybdate ABC transporter permease subunit [Salinicoccus cyprini]